MKSIGLNETGLTKVIKTGYYILDLITYFTSGQKETRAWTIKKNTLAPKAASVILGGKGGGGRKDFAQAGGEDKNKIKEAFKEILKKIS